MRQAYMLHAPARCYSMLYIPCNDRFPSILLYKNIQCTHLIFKSACSKYTIQKHSLTIARPRIMEHQKRTFWLVVSKCDQKIRYVRKSAGTLTLSSFRLRTTCRRCTATMGNCDICAANPYPRSFLVIQPMTNSCPRALRRKVMSVAVLRDTYGLEAP